jgi:hypothetical protein
MQETCRHPNDTLMMDVLGELNDTRLRGPWEEHLKECVACRRERDRMLRLISDVRQTGTPPELTPAQTQAMADGVGWRLRNERLGRLEKSGRRLRLVPALAAACTLLVVVFFGYRLTDRLYDREGGGDISAELNAEDLEVINHLDLLKNMDTIEKLIHVVDLPSNGLTPDEAPPETQGMYQYDGGGMASA